MFNRATSFIFNRHGEIINKLIKHQTPKLSRTIVKLRDKSSGNFMLYASDIYVRVQGGIVMLVITKDDTTRSYERFVIHHHIKIREGIGFDFLCISSSAKLEVEMGFKAKKKQTSIYDHNPTVYGPIVPTFEIKETLAYYYQVRNANYTFPDEKYNYWELTFIDNGELEVTADGETCQLDELDLILYVPGQHHTQKTDHAKSCSYLIIMFDMGIPDSYLVASRVYNAHHDIHNALDNFVRVSGNDVLYDSELMLYYMKELLIKILQYDFLTGSLVASAPMQQRFENELLNEIVIFINDSIYEQITIEETCPKFSIPRSSLQTLFRNNLEATPKQYIGDLKLGKSKLLIKESVYTINETASMMEFTSIHYFSRKFKQRFDIAPTGYAKAIYN